MARIIKRQMGGRKGGKDDEVNKSELIVGQYI